VRGERWEVSIARRKRKDLGNELVAFENVLSLKPLNLIRS